MGSSSPCTTRERLELEYSNHAARFIEAHAAAEQNAGSSDLLDITFAAKANGEEAYAALHSHIAEHGC